jgi:hypothetical protein
MGKDDQIKTENKDDNILRITITKEADKELERLVVEINDGFTAGRVSKQDVASWFFMNFKELCDSDYINKIRADFFNELARFKNLFKLAQQSGSITPEIRKALKELSDDAAKPKKVKKNLKLEYIKDISPGEGAA